MGAGGWDGRVADAVVVHHDEHLLLDELLGLLQVRQRRLGGGRGRPQDGVVDLHRPRQRPLQRLRAPAQLSLPCTNEETTKKNAKLDKNEKKVRFETAELSR